MEALKVIGTLMSTVFAAVALLQQGPVTEVPKEAVVVLSPTEGHNVHGTVTLEQKGDAVVLTGEVRGLEPGEHGFHIHEFGDLRDPEGKSAGDHFNPERQRHGGPDDRERHAGDLGNITANDDGIAKVEKRIDRLELHFVIGRSLVVHADADDFRSQPSGNAGARVALGVIGFAQVKEDDHATPHVTSDPRSASQRQ